MITLFRRYHTDAARIASKTGFTEKKTSSKLLIVSWFTDRQLFVLAVVFYGLSTVYSVFLWRRGFRQDNRVNYCLLLAGFCCNVLAMTARGLSFSRCPVANLYEATVFITWAIVAVYLVIGLWWRLRFLGAFASPVLTGLGVFGLMPALDQATGGASQTANGWSSLHAGLILLAYGAFGLSSVAGLMYLSQEHNLKFHKLRAVLSLLPPIERLERTIGRLLLVGLVLFTAGMVVGVVWVTPPPGTRFAQDPKVIWSMFLWFVYVGLVVMRWYFRQGGRRFAWGAVGTFAFVLLTFWGTNLLSAIHHP
ncbi:MAG: inner membrane protein YpjD [Verrucomicrobiia bacterium]